MIGAMKLGINQQGVLDSLHQHGGFWQSGCGWLWDTDSGTTRIMESLLKRGLVTREGAPTTILRQGYLYRLVKEEDHGS